MALQIGKLFVALDAETSAFGRKMQGVAQTIDKLSKQVKRMAGDIASAGAAMTAFAAGMLMAAAKADKGVARTVDELKGSFTSLAIQVSQVLLPAVQQLSSFLQLLAGWFRSLSPETKALVADFGVAATTVGALAFGVSKLAPLVGIVAQGFGLVGSAIVALGAPGLAIIAALVGGAVLIHKAWRENWGGVQQIVATVVKNVAGYWERFRAWFAGDFLDSVIEVAAEFAKAFGKAQIYAEYGASKLGIGQEFNLDQRLGAYDKQVAGQVAGFKAPGGLTKPFELVVDQLADVGRDFVKELEMMVDEALGPFAAKAKALIASIKPVGAYHAPALPGGAGMADAHVQAYYQHQYGNASVEELTRVGKLGDADEQGNTTAATAEAYREEIEAHEAFTAQINTITQGLAGAGMRLASKLGEAGDLIQAGVQGFQQGGIWGMFAALIVELASKFEGWAKIMDVANGQFKTLLADLQGPMNELLGTFKGFMGALGMIGKALHPLIGFILNLVERVFKHLTPVFAMIGVILEPLGQIFEMLGGFMDALDGLVPIFKIVNTVLSFVAITILGTILGVMELFNGFIDMIWKVLVDMGLNDAAKGLKNTIGNLDTNKVKKQIDDLATGIVASWTTRSNTSDGPLTDLANKSADAAEGLGHVDDATKGATEAVESFTEAILNAPTGYRVNNGRYNATMVDATAAYSDGGVSTIYIETLNVDSNDPDSFSKKLSAASKQKSFQKTGNPYAKK